MGPRRTLKLVICAAIAFLVLLPGAALAQGESVSVGGQCDKTAGGRADLIQPRQARDLNSDPDVVEVEVVAREAQVSFTSGKRTSVYTYNGGIPGPTIAGKVGDTLVVRFRNELPEATTIHWHGLELPANMDGSNIAQLAVEPGGTFRYEFKLLRAATFWYHPHIRTNVQLEKGLYGLLVVRDPAQDTALGLPECAHELVLDDVLLDAKGRVEEPFPSDPVENAEMQLNGREGNVLLVNGRAKQKASLRRGIPQRIRILNASNARFMRISIPGQDVWRIGGDGGLLEEPLELLPIPRIQDPHHPDQLISDPDPSKGLLLTPGERADLVLTPTGDELKIKWHDVPRGRHDVFTNPDGSLGIGHAHDDGARRPQTLMRASLSGPESVTVYAPPSILRGIERLDPVGASLIPVRFGHSTPSETGDVVFFAMMNESGLPLPFPALSTSQAPVIQVGETRVWEVWNLTGGDHNFHTHGFHFQLLETEYVDWDTPANNRVVPAPYLEDKDTILVPRRSGAKGRSRTVVRLVQRFDDKGREGQIVASGKTPSSGRSGGWLFHCHMLEHAARGMMGFFQIVDGKRDYVVKNARLKRFYATKTVKVDGDEAVKRKLRKYMQMRIKGPTKRVHVQVQIFSKTGELLVSVKRLALTDRIRRVPRLTLKTRLAKRAHVVRVVTLGPSP
jgi:FtsP/CotA-like multicopper oxidase with cupredoxin domain